MISAVLNLVPNITKSPQTISLPFIPLFYFVFIFFMLAWKLLALFSPNIISAQPLGKLLQSQWNQPLSKKEIRHCKGLENYPKFQCLSQIFINPNRTHSALLLFPLSPKYFLVENRLFMLQLTVYVHFWWTQMGAPACTGCSELGLIADCRQKTQLEADT